jgi:4-hydroxy-2-oxoglutarate aldolase
MTNAALAAHYRAVADESPIPVIIYNMPGNTGLNLGSELVAELSNYPNIVGLKDSSGNIVQIAEIVAMAKEGFAVFAGSGSYLLPTLAVGGVGATAAVSNVFPDECAAVISLFDQGDIRGARELQLKLMKVNRAVTGRWGVPGLKAALDIIGLYGGPPRRPMLPLGEAERQELAMIIDRTGFPSGTGLSGA